MGTATVFVFDENKPSQGIPGLVFVPPVAVFQSDPTALLYTDQGNGNYTINWDDGVDVTGAYVILTSTLYLAAYGSLYDGEKGRIPLAPKSLSGGGGPIIKNVVQTTTNNFVTISFNVQLTQGESISEFDMNWGDGQPDDISKYNNQTSTAYYDQHFYENLGTYTITITMTDSAGLTNSFSLQVTITANPPLAQVGSIQTSPGNPVVVVTPFISYFAGNTPPNVVWDWGDGQQAPQNTFQFVNMQFAQPISHKYDADGTYDIKLTVTDATGQVGASNETVTISNLYSQPVIIFDGLQVSALTTGDTLVVTGTVTQTDQNTPIQSASINWGDSKTNQPLALNFNAGHTTASFSSRHTYAYLFAQLATVTVTVVDATQNTSGSKLVILPEVAIFNPVIRQGIPSRSPPARPETFELAIYPPRPRARGASRKKSSR